MSDKVAGVAVQILVMAIFLSLVLIFVGIGFLILIHVWIVGRAFRRGLGNGSNMVVMVGSATTTGGGKMSKEDLEKLPMYDYIAREKGSSPVDCAVCLDNFKMGEKCRLLPLCKHSFHAQCVDAWLMQTLSCPLCRASTADDSKDGGLLPGTDVGVELSDRQATGNRDLSDHRVDLEESQAT